VCSQTCRISERHQLQNAQKDTTARNRLIVTTLLHRYTRRANLDESGLSQSNKNAPKTAEKHDC
jgi:hypothetical protein